MSKVSIQGDASGTGTLTIAAPNTNSNYTLTLPTETGTIITKDGSNDVTLNDITAGGIYLGGTGAANYLDDYEEGTWTPTLTASGYTFTHTAQYGFYTKVGNLVTVKLYMIASYSSGSGTAVGGIYGLPFQSGSSYANYGGGSWFPDTGSQFFSRTGAVRTQRNATFLRLGNGFGGSTLQSNFDWSTMPSSMEFEISAQYFTD